MKLEPLDLTENFLGQNVSAREMLKAVLSYYEATKWDNLPTLDQLVDWAREAKRHWKSDPSGRPSGKALTPWVIKMVGEGLQMWVHKRPLGGSRSHIILKSFSITNRGVPLCQPMISIAPPVKLRSTTKGSQA
jgi:hypothetical protein